MQATNTSVFYAKCYERDRPSYNALLPPLYIDKHLALPSKCEASHFDGVGECFEQHAIKFGEVEMYAHLWNCNNSWSIQTEQELFSAVFGCNVPGADPKVYEQAPQMGGMTLG